MCKKLITIDLGNTLLKVFSEKGGVFYENRMIEKDPSQLIDEEHIIVDGKCYVMGIGSYQHQFIKTSKAFLPQVLYCVAKNLLNSKNTVNLILGLPASQIENKSILIEALANKTFDVVVNGEAKKLKIGTVGCVAEGVSSFYSLPHRQGKIAIVDLGSRTTSVVTFTSGKQDATPITINIGTTNLLSKIKDKMLSMGITVELEKVWWLLEGGNFDLKLFDAEIKEHMKQLKNEIMKDCPLLQFYDIRLCGGGTHFLKNEFKDSFPKVDVIDKYLFANAQGNYNIGVAKGLDK